MPLHSYKTFVGLALDRVNAVLGAPVAAAATSLPLISTVGTTGTITTAGATYSAIIVDGPNTEIVACSGNLTTGAIAVGALANAHPIGTYVFFQLTASKGPTAYMPLTTFAPADEYAQLLNQAYYGSAVKTAGAVQGKRSSTWDIGGDLFIDTVGYLFGGIFGCEDFTAGTPNMHLFAVNNVAQCQPTPIVLYNYDGLNTRIFAGGKFSEVGLTLDPAQLMKHTSKFMARASGVVNTPVPSFSALQPVPAWTGYLTVAGSVLLKATAFEITFTRDESEVIPTLQGNQDPYSVWVGPLETKGKVTYVKEDDTQYALWTGESQPSLVVSSSQGSGGTATQLNISMNQCNYDSVKIIEQGKSYVTEEVEFEAIGNSTDANVAGGGLSAGRVLLENAIATGIYT